MSADEQSVLFISTKDEIAEVRKAFGLTENSIREGVDSITEWFDKQPHLARAEFNRVFAELMIIIAKGSIERAKEKIDNYYKCKFYMPELMQNREEILYSSNKIWELYSIVPMPNLQDNRRVFILKFGPEGSKFDLVEFFRRINMLLDLRLKYDYMVGDIWIMDMVHVGWTQILSQNPMVIKKMAQLFTKAFNWRMYGIHVINMAASAAIIQRLLDFFNHFISSHLMKRLVVHDSLEDLYKCVPKECLPEDYGGNEPSMQKLTEITESEFRKPKTIEYLLMCTRMISDESLRPRDKTSEEFLAGSFKKLEVD